MVVERAVKSSDFVSLSYFGTMGTHLSMVQDSNSPVYIPGVATQTNAQARRANANIGRLNTEVDWGNSNYNALEATYRHRYHGGFTPASTFDWNVGAWFSDPNFSTYLTTLSFCRLEIVWERQVLAGLQAREIRAFCSFR
jgi:hypothetical protein